MKVLLKNECNRAFKSKWFFITIAICMTIVGYDIINQIIPTRQNLDFYIGIENYQIPGLYTRWMELNGQSIARKIFHFIFPLITCLPYAITLYSDVKSKYIYSIFTRIDKKKYFLSKLIVQFLVGFAVVGITLTVSFVITAMILPADFPLASSSTYLIGGPTVLSYIFFRHPFISVIICIIAESLMYGIINCIAYIFAYVMENGVVVMASAFIIYFFEGVIVQMFGGQSIMNRSFIPLLYVSWTGLLVIELVAIVFMAVIVCVACSRAKDNL